MDFVVAAVLTFSTLAPLAMIWFAPAQELRAPIDDWKKRYGIDEQVVATYSNGPASLDRAA